jgi:hypothetical protein
MSLFLSQFAAANEGEKSLSASYFKIKSDKKNPNVESGKCLVTGNVYYNKESVEGATVGLSTRELLVTSNDKGAFSFTIDEKDSSIFCFKRLFTEIVVWNYDFKSGHEVQVDFYLEKEERNYNVKKPVIYLYSDEDLDANIQLDSKVEIEFTYPLYTNSWDVEVLPDGGINCKDMIYPYLFWDGKGNLSFEKDQKNNSMKGFFFESKDAISFLEEKLTALGLNSIEQTDFITFWGPQMIQSKYVLVQFQTEKWYNENISELIIEPKPESTRRIYMLMMNYESIPDINFVDQEFESFSRSGFTLVEWGGSVISTIKTL